MADPVILTRTRLESILDQTVAHLISCCRLPLPQRQEPSRKETESPPFG